MIKTRVDRIAMLEATDRCRRRTPMSFTLDEGVISVPQTDVDVE